MDKKISTQAQWEKDRKADGWRYVRTFLAPDELTAFDKARGKQSRSAFVKAAVMKEIGE